MNHLTFSGKYYIAILLFILINALPNAMAATAEISSTAVSQGKMIQLLLTAGGQQATIADPDLSPLEHDFYIYGVARGSQIQILNGVSSAKRQWTITLLPKTSGFLSIPALTIGNEKTDPIQVQVNKVDRNQEKPAVFIEANWTPKQPYVQSQLLYTVKLFYDIDLVNGEITNPSSPNIIVNRFKDDKYYQAMRYGKLYNVIERRYALFAKVSGDLTIQPPIFIGETADHNAGIPSFLTNTQRVQAAAPATTVHVSPQPGHYHGQYWLPSTNITLTDTWSENPPTFQVGEAITRTITIRAHGLSAEQLPKLPVISPTGIKLYPDKPQLENTISSDQLIGTVQQKIAYIPNKTGKVTLPAITLTWFDITSHKTKVAKLPIRVITVIPSSTTTINDTTTSTVTVSENLNNKAQSETDHYQWQWVITAIAFALLWLITTIIWLLTGRKYRKTNQQTNIKKQVKCNRLIKQLKQTCQQYDYRQIVKILITLAQTQYQDKSIINLNKLTCYLQNEQAKTFICTLIQQLYAPEQHKKEISTIWKSVKLVIADIEATAKLAKQENKTKTMLPELY